MIVASMRDDSITLSGNPYRDPLNYAAHTSTEALKEYATSQRQRRQGQALIDIIQVREENVRRLVDACLTAANRTGIPPLEVERRV
jgi:hypothetical protein